MCIMHPKYKSTPAKIAVTGVVFFDFTVFHCFSRNCRLTCGIKIFVCMLQP